jgi:hypothetical protein
MNPDNCRTTSGPKVLPLTESVGIWDNGVINPHIAGRLTIASAPAEHEPTGGAVKPDGGSVCPRVEDFEE